MKNHTIHTLVVVGAFASTAAMLVPAFADAVNIFTQNRDTAHESIQEQWGTATLPSPDITLVMASGIEFAHAAIE